MRWLLLLLLLLPVETVVRVVVLGVKVLVVKLMTIVAGVESENRSGLWGSPAL